MTNFNTPSEFIFSAAERELLTLSTDEIIQGLMADYKKFSPKTDAGIRIPDGKREPRQAHSCILYAEALRLAHAHLEMAEKLMLASLFEFNSQAAGWIKAWRREEERSEKPVDILKMISDVPHYSTRAVAWLNDNGGAEYLKQLLHEIEAFEACKAAERKAMIA